MNFFSAIGQTVAGVSGDIQAVQDAATQAFYVVAGELLLVILLLAYIAYQVQKP